MEQQTLEKQVESLEKQEQTLEKQTQTLEKQGETLEKQGQTMTVFTLITAVFMPLGFVAAVGSKGFHSPEYQLRIANSLDKVFCH